MGIYNPEVYLTRDDRELLRLGELLLTCEGSRSANAAPGEIPLSRQESVDLLHLLEQFVTSKKFVEGSYFIEKLFSENSLYDGVLRDLYLGWRRRYGKSRAVATVQWENFLGRLGIWTTDRGNPQRWYRASASPMSLEHFLKMERRLSSATGLHPRVQALVLRFVGARAAAVDRVRKGQERLRPGQVREPPTRLLRTLRSDTASAVGLPPISSGKIAAVLTIVMDFSTLFTTRDWSVASVLSATAGAVPVAVLD